jgi:hypothetical protein
MSESQLKDEVFASIRRVSAAVNARRNRTEEETLKAAEIKSGSKDRSQRNPRWRWTILGTKKRGFPIGYQRSLSQLQLCEE